MKDDNSGFKKEYFYKGLTAFLVVAACVVFFFIVFRLPSISKYVKTLISVMQPIIIGLVVAYLVNPINNIIYNFSYKLLSKKFKNKKLAGKISDCMGVFVSLVIFVLAIFLLFYSIVPQFISSITNLVTVLPGQIDSLTSWATKLLKENKQLENLLVSALNYEKKWLQTDLTTYVNKWAGYFATGIWGVVTFLSNFAIGILFSIYVLFNKKLLARQTRKLLYAIMGKKAVGHILDVGKKGHEIFSGFIFGKVIDSLIVGVLCFLGCLIMKIPYPVLMAVVIGVTNTIPVFGPYIGTIPCAALILLISPVKCLYFVIFNIVMQTIDGNIISPKILGDSTGVSAFWAMFAIIVGGGMFGVVGMLIGVPVFAVIYYIITTVMNHFLVRKKMPLASDYYDDDICEKLESQNQTIHNEVTGVESDNVSLTEES